MLQGGMTSLWIAAAGGRTGVVDVLIKAGANVDAAINDDKDEVVSVH
jgi:hypothetical protein